MKQLAWYCAELGITQKQLFEEFTVDFLSKVGEALAEKYER